MIFLYIVLFIHQFVRIDSKLAIKLTKSIQNHFLYYSMENEKINDKLSIDIKNNFLLLFYYFIFYIC